MSAPRVRFAPAPSGWLHVGSVRTALYNWLHARGNGGTFVFRIEDTDAERATEESMRSMLEAMAWLGIGVDEGVVLDGAGGVTEVGAHGPYRQSRRAELHAAVARRLRDAGHLYEDDRTPDELDEWRTQRRKDDLPPIVKRDTVPAATGDRPATLRLALPTSGSVTVDDDVRGEVTWEWANESDPVLVRSNGAVTYPLANSTDDVAQGITTVCRGEDLLSVTPRQVFLYDLLLADGLLDEALEEAGLPAREDGWGAPSGFAHLSMVVGSDRKKLSKRHGAVSVQALRDEGYLPEVLLNAIALLGWAPADGRERLTIDELVAAFDLSRVNNTAAAFDVDKLTAFNGERIRELDDANLAGRLEPFVADAVDRDLDARDREVVAGLVPLVQERMQRLDEVGGYVGPFLAEEVPVDEEQCAKVLRHATALPAIEASIVALRGAEWDEESLEAALRDVAAEQEVGFGKVAQAVRVGVTGTTVSPPLFGTLALIGRERSLARLEGALPVFRRHAPSDDA